MAIVGVSILLIGAIGHDLQQRVQTSQNVADAAAEDRDTPDEAALQGEDIGGPNVVAAYFRQGYAWAQSHGVVAASHCPADNRAYRDGCRAFVAGVRESQALRRPA